MPISNYVFRFISRSVCVSVCVCVCVMCGLGVCLCVCGVVFGVCECGMCLWCLCVCVSAVVRFWCVYRVWGVRWVSEWCVCGVCCGCV